jgi:acyl-CoA thioesterase FadM
MQAQRPRPSAGSASWPIAAAGSRPCRAFTAPRRRAPPTPTTNPPLAAAAKAAPTDQPVWAFVSEPQRVRDYELDVFQVVNNGVYASLFQDARHLALEKMTGTSVTAYLEKGVLMALSELIIRYKAPLRSGDWYVSRVGVAEVRGTRVTLAQQVVRVVDGSKGCAETAEGEVAAEGSATVVFLDRAYRPARMPADAKQAFERAAAGG